MRKFFTKSQPAKQPVSESPSEALERIRETKEQKIDVLDLSQFLLVELPPEIFELSELTDLNLSDNRLTTLPEALTRLRNLTSLNLRGNQLTTIPEAITDLSNLRMLDLSSNKLRTIPETVINLQNLMTLDLSGNPLSMVPESISHLKNLRILHWSNNPFSQIPEAITGLPNLRTLDLSGNPFSTIPTSITKLQNLTSLNLIGNQLTTLPESITRLENLRTLYLSINQISTLPESITRLENLIDLDLSYNVFETLPESITELPNLMALDLRGNQLSQLSGSLFFLPNLKTLDLRNNPLISPPIEIATQGIEATREYFRQLDQQGVDYLYEAKLLIVGEAGAGKTTFANKILDSNYVLREEDSTKGVAVLKWSFPMVGDHPFKVNIWDFGGQEIYHATHQFFLTRRSLYALVADTRREDTDFYYWLNVVELLSDSSPLLIIKNEKQDRHREIPTLQLKGQFEGLKGVLATNLATNRGLEEVRDDIKYYIQKLPQIGTPLPKFWVRVRERLERDLRNYISLEEYLAICKENGFNNAKDSLQLSGYLHDIGVFLHFQDEPLLRKMIILKPRWGTGAVYKVLDNKMIINNLGRFTRTELETVWNAPEYENMRDELLQLMMKFKLCYEIPNQRGVYIAPQLLTENQPDYEWDDHENLLLRYTYEFMPKGILTQFIVVMHPYIWKQKTVWKSGVVIEKEGTLAEVIEYYGKREIHVRVAGPQARDLLTIIRHELRQIHDAYKRLKYDELVRCNCSTCKDSQEPHFYPVAVLMEFRANNQLEIQCQKKPYNMINVMGLLGDVIDLSKLSERDLSPSIYVQGNYYGGDTKMTKINQTVKDSIIHGSVVAAENIKDSFNVIEKSNINDDLKEQLKQLAQAVDDMVKELPKEKAEEVAEDMKVLVEQATKEKPNPKWYNVSIDGLIAAAQNLGNLGEAVIDLSGKVRKTLTGGLL